MNSDHTLLQPYAAPDCCVADIVPDKVFLLPTSNTELIEGGEDPYIDW